MKKLTLAMGLVLALGMVGSPVWAASVNDTDQVTISVNGVLAISDTTGDFTLTFSDFEIGTDSDTQAVTYRVKSNNMVDTALDGVVSAQIDSAIYGVALKADVGTYANIGSTGNVALTEHAAGFATVGTTAVNLAKKATTTGNQKKILNGNLPITWKATATEDLTEGDYTTNLTVTLKDA